MGKTHSLPKIFHLDVRLSVSVHIPLVTTDFVVAVGSRERPGNYLSTKLPPSNAIASWGWEHIVGEQLAVSVPVSYSYITISYSNCFRKFSILFGEYIAPVLTTSVLFCSVLELC